MHDKLLMCDVEGLSVEKTSIMEYCIINHVSTMGGDGGCRVSEVRADTTSSMPDHKGFKLQ